MDNVKNSIALSQWSDLSIQIEGINASVVDENNEVLITMPVFDIVFILSSIGTAILKNTRYGEVSIPLDETVVVKWTTSKVKYFSKTSLSLGIWLSDDRFYEILRGDDIKELADNIKQLVDHIVPKSIAVAAV